MHADAVRPSLRVVALRGASTFAAAVVATAAVGSVVQTQVNLAALIEIGASVPLSVRAATTAEDLLRFGPVMAAIAAAAFLPAFAVAAAAARFAPLARSLAFAAAGAAGLWTAFSIMGFFTPMPVLVMAARGAAGLALMCATGLLGGLVFSWLSKPSARVS